MLVTRGIRFRWLVLKRPPSVRRRCFAVGGLTTRRSRSCQPEVSFGGILALADRDVTIFRDQPSSSLDPSAIHTPGHKSRTDKLGLDATIPWDTPTGPSNPEHFQRVPFPQVNPAEYF